MNDATRGGSTAAFSSSKAGRVLSAEAPSLADPRVDDVPVFGTGSGSVILAGEDGVTGIRSKVEVHGPGDDARLQEMLQTIGQQDGLAATDSAEQNFSSNNKFQTASDSGRKRKWKAIGAQSLVRSTSPNHRLCDQMRINTFSPRTT